MSDQPTIRQLVKDLLAVCGDDRLSIDEAASDETFVIVSGVAPYISQSWLWAAASELEIMVDINHPAMVALEQSPDELIARDDGLPVRCLLALRLMPRTRAPVNQRDLPPVRVEGHRTRFVAHYDSSVRLGGSTPVWPAVEFEFRCDFTQRFAWVLESAWYSGG